ncbi:MAG: 3-isopropylmalate dehydratase small subunit [Cyanobacteria bacterium REEB459]|nr:3-isopropylmalate dehydratase small subunit [Cyanobacteria bacterium REEB459]
MSSIELVTGTAIPLVGNDIDTDRIIPARFLKAITFDGLGAEVFADDRAALAGRHAFDQPQYQGATILVVNRNFGCGSSREHAPQAIARWGIRAILGESFAEIFFGNCLAIGIPCLTASPEVITQVQATLATQPDQPLRIDLGQLELGWGGRVAPLAIPPGARQAFLEGNWDACGQLVANTPGIRATAARLPYFRW